MLTVKTFALSAITALAGAGATLAPVVSARAQSEQITKEDFIAGSMQIDFKTRTEKDTSGDLKEGSAAIGAKDRYTFTIRVADTIEFAGEVQRQPNLFTKTLARKKQDAQLFYKVNLSAFNPKDLKQKKTVGSWVGTVPIDTASGAYDLSGGAAKESALRMAIDTVGASSGFTEGFAGRLVGKAEKKETLAEYTFKRAIGDRTVEVKVKKSDPMRFDNIALAKGPVASYPRTTVNGRLDYDYETSNWYTDGIRFAYAMDGKDFEDIITGSIKWVEDPSYDSNGKGYYEFNLRFNEAKNKKAAGESAAFDKMSDEDAFFAVDDTVPCLTGRVAYVDTMSGEEVIGSKIEYHLNANKLTKQQVMNFFKLWMLAIGPTNDD